MLSMKLPEKKEQEFEMRTNRLRGIYLRITYLQMLLQIYLPMYSQLTLLYHVLLSQTTTLLTTRIMKTNSMFSYKTQTMF